MTAVVFPAFPQVNYWWEQWGKDSCPRFHCISDGGTNHVDAVAVVWNIKFSSNFHLYSTNSDIFKLLTNTIKKLRQNSVTWLPVLPSGDWFVKTEKCKTGLKNRRIVWNILKCSDILHYCICMILILVVAEKLSQSSLVIHAENLFISVCVKYEIAQIFPKTACHSSLKWFLH